MTNKLRVLFMLFILSGLSSCVNQNPNVDEAGKDQFQSLELDHRFAKNELEYQDTVYVPIYSDIYIDTQNPKSLLAATLSIRNTSHKDSLFISNIDYYNTDGKLVRSYINNLISLPPMATVNYVIEKDDDTGGHGANFIIALSSKNQNIARPVIQAIMIGQNGNKGFSFVTDGYSVKSSKSKREK